MALTSPAQDARTASASDPGGPIFEKGYDQLNSKHYDEAIATFRQYLKVEPDDPSAYFNIGTAYYGLKRFDQAIAEFGTAVRMKPEYAKAWRYLGGSYFNLKRYPDAVTAYRNAVKYQKDYVEAWVWLGSSLENLDRHDEAIDAYVKATELDPDDEMAYYGLGAALFSKGEYKASIGALKKWDELTSHSSADTARRKTAALYLGHAYMEVKQYDDAVAAFMRVIAIDQNDPRAILGLGEVYVAMKRPQMVAIQKAKLDRLDPAFAARLDAKIAAAGLK